MGTIIRLSAAAAVSLNEGMVIIHVANVVVAVSAGNKVAGDCVLWVNIR